MGKPDTGTRTGAARIGAGTGAGTTTGLGFEGKGLMVPSYLTSATYPVASDARYLKIYKV